MVFMCELFFGSVLMVSCSTYEDLYLYFQFDLFHMGIYLTFPPHFYLYTHITLTNVDWICMKELYMQKYNSWIENISSREMGNVTQPPQIALEIGITSSLFHF